jgi:hypothetical protein
MWIWWAVYLKSGCIVTGQTESCLAGLRPLLFTQLRERFLMDKSRIRDTQLLNRREGSTVEYNIYSYGITDCLIAFSIKGHFLNSPVSSFA